MSFSKFVLALDHLHIHRPSRSCLLSFLCHPYIPSFLIQRIFCLLVIISDQLLMYYGFSHRSVKWWKRISFHILDLALVNSHILLKEYCHHHLSAPEPPLCLTERAFPQPISGRMRVDCVVGSNRGTEQHHTTWYRCKLYRAPLCLHTRVSKGSIHLRITSKYKI